MTRMIERNTTIPTRRTEVYTTAEDNQPSVEIHVLQGEREMSQFNKTAWKNFNSLTFHQLHEEYRKLKSHLILTQTESYTYLPKTERLVKNNPSPSPDNPHLIKTKSIK